MNTIEIVEIKKLLPHRYPFLLVDRVLNYEKGKSILALKNVTTNENFFTGHFPEKPVMPGFLILEALAQAGGVLACITKPEYLSRWFYLAGVNNARFKRPVVPGDQLHLEVAAIRNKLDLWVFEAKATVDGEIACAAELLIAKGGLK